jgi:hypothetical protein
MWTSLHLSTIASRVLSGLLLSVRFTAISCVNVVDHDFVPQMLTAVPSLLDFSTMPNERGAGSERQKPWTKMQRVDVIVGRLR